MFDSHLYINITLYIGCSPGYPGNYYVGDLYDRCVYYWCVNGEFVEEGEAFRCAPGVGVPEYFRSGDNPCTEHISECADPNSGKFIYNVGRSTFVFNAVKHPTPEAAQVTIETSAMVHPPSSLTLLFILYII